MLFLCETFFIVTFLELQFVIPRSPMIFILLGKHLRRWMMRELRKWNKFCEHATNVMEWSENRWKLEMFHSLEMALEPSVKQPRTGVKKAECGGDYQIPRKCTSNYSCCWYVGLARGWQVICRLCLQTALICKLRICKRPLICSNSIPLPTN